MPGFIQGTEKHSTAFESWPPPLRCSVYIARQLALNGGDHL